MKDRLNVGCGQKALEGYWNIDKRPLFGVDQAVDALDADYALETFSEILCSDFIEHLSFSDGRTLLRKMFRWLKPNGALVLHTPNLRVLSSILSQRTDHEALKWLYGTDGVHADYGENHHKWCYSREDLKATLEDLGYRLVASEVTCGGFGIRIVAVK